MVIEEVNSNQIRSVSYVKSIRQMVVEKTDGKILVFKSISDAAFGAFMASKSHNIDYHYQKHIEPIYPCQEDVDTCL